MKRLSQMLAGAADSVLVTLWKEISKNGIQNIDREILQAFYKEFEARPHVLDEAEGKGQLRAMMSTNDFTVDESINKLTKKQLKRIIREERKLMKKGTA